MLTAVVDLPTPPLPEATAMIFLTPRIFQWWSFSSDLTAVKTTEALDTPSSCKISFLRELIRVIIARLLKILTLSIFSGLKYLSARDLTASVSAMSGPPVDM